MSFLWNWFSSMLNYLGISKKTGNIVFLGLDNAGKTTLLHMFKMDDRMAPPVPTVHSTSEELSLNGTRFTIYEFDDLEQARRARKNCFPAVDAIVFIVDAADVNRLEEARNKLYSLLNDEIVRHVHVLILGNKIDKPNAISEEYLKSYLNIMQMCTGKGEISHSNLSARPLEVFMCSIVRRQGYGEGFRWILQYLD